MSEKSNVSWRIVSDINGEFRIEVLDKTLNYWYIVASRMGQGWKGFQNAIEYCMENFKNAKDL